MMLILAAIYNGVLAIVCGYALLRGGKPERIGASINLIASVVTGTISFTAIAPPAQEAVVTFLIDISVTLSFYWLAVRTTRFWPVWAFGFALADLIASVSCAVLPHLALFIYHTGLVIDAYLALSALALGIYKIPSDADPIVKDGFRETWRRSQKQMN